MTVHSDLRLNAVYYIVKCLIPALNRVLTLVGVDASEWYSALPRPTSRPINSAAFIRIGKSKSNYSTKIENFFKSSSCIVCGSKDSFELSRNGASIRICRSCSDPTKRQECIGNLLYRLQNIEQTISAFYLLNGQHLGFAGGLGNLEEPNADQLHICWSFDCPYFWKAVALRQSELPLLRNISNALQALSNSCR